MVQSWALIVQTPVPRPRPVAYALRSPRAQNELHDYRSAGELVLVSFLLKRAVNYRDYGLINMELCT